MCGEAYWIAYYYYFISIFFFFFFFSNICDYIKEGPVLLLLFPSLSLCPLIGPLKHGEYVSAVWFVCLSGCYVVMLRNKKEIDWTKIASMEVLQAKATADQKEHKGSPHICQKIS